MNVGGVLFFICVDLTETQNSYKVWQTDVESMYPLSSECGTRSHSTWGEPARTETGEMTSLWMVVNCWNFLSLVMWRLVTEHLQYVKRLLDIAGNRDQWGRCKKTESEADDQLWPWWLAEQDLQVLTACSDIYSTYITFTFNTRNVFPHNCYVILTTFVACQQ